MGLNIQPHAHGRVILASKAEVLGSSGSMSLDERTVTSSGNLLLAPDVTGKVSMTNSLIVDDLKLAVNDASLSIMSTSTTNPDIILKPHADGTVALGQQASVDNIEISGNTIFTEDQLGSGLTLAAMPDKKIIVQKHQELASFIRDPSSGSFITQKPIGIVRAGELNLTGVNDATIRSIVANGNINVDSRMTYAENALRVDQLTMNGTEITARTPSLDKNIVID